MYQRSWSSERSKSSVHHVNLQTQIKELKYGLQHSPPPLSATPQPPTPPLTYSKADILARSTIIVPFFLTNIEKRVLVVLILKDNCTQTTVILTCSCHWRARTGWLSVRIIRLSGVITPNYSIDQYVYMLWFHLSVPIVECKSTVITNCCMVELAL